MREYSKVELFGNKAELVWRLIFRDLNLVGTIFLYRHLIVRDVFFTHTDGIG